MNRFLTLCAALLMAGAASCNGRPDTPQAQPADVQTVAAQADTAKFHVKTIDASLRGNATLKAIAAQYAGKVVLIDEALRASVREMAARLDVLRRTFELPPAEPGPKCRRCSLRELCMPEVKRSAQAYCRQLEREAREVDAL